MARLFVEASALFCLIFAAYLWLTDSGLSPLLTLLAVAPTLLLAPLVMQMGQSAVFSPLFLIYAMSLFGNTVRYFVLSLSTDYFDRRYYLVALRPDELTYGAQVYLLGVVALAVGYVLATSSAKASPAAEAPNAAGRPHFVLDQGLFYGAVALFVFVLAPYLAQTGFADDLSSKRVLVDDDGTTYRFGASRFVLAILSVFFQLSLVYAQITKDRRLRVVGIASFACLVFLSFALSKRSLLLASLLPVVLLYVQRLDFRSQMRTAVFAALMLAIAAVVTVERRGDDGSHGGYLDRVAEAGREVFLSANFSGLVATAVSTAPLDGELPPLGGSTYVVDPLAQFIPRSLWRDKPEELGGRLREYLQDAGFAPRNLDSGGVAPGAIGEAWLNFRLPGVALVLLVLGYGAGRAYAWTRSSSFANPLNKAAYLCFLPNLTLFYFGGHFARFVLVNFTLLVAVVMLRRCLKAPMLPAVATRRPPVRRVPGAAQRSVAA